MVRKQYVDNYEDLNVGIITIFWKATYISNLAMLISIIYDAKSGVRRVQVNVFLLLW